MLLLDKYHVYVEICTHSLEVYIFGEKHCNMFHANKEFVFVKIPSIYFSNYSKSKNMSVGKLCIKLFDFECKNILNPETVSKVPRLCCCYVMDIQVPPVPNQPKTFQFSPRTFDVNKRPTGHGSLT